MWFFDRFSAFYGQRSVTASWATRSPWSISLFLFFSTFYGQRLVTAAWATRSPWSISSFSSFSMPFAFHLFNRNQKRKSLSPNGSSICPHFVKNVVWCHTGQSSSKLGEYSFEQSLSDQTKQYSPEQWTNISNWNLTVCFTLSPQ